MGLLDVLLRKVIRIGGGADLPERKTWNLVSGATAVDNPITGATDITLASGSFTPPTGTGLCTVTSGILDVASEPVASGFYTFIATPSGANLAALLTSALPVSKGGTNRTALGTGLQVLRTNAGATDTEWATPSAGGSSAGSQFAVQMSDGASGFQATGAATLPTSLAIGTTPAASGIIMLPNGAGTSAINARNGANNADITLTELTSGNLATFGGDINLTKVSTSAYILALSSVIVNVNSSARLTIDNTFAYFQVPIIGGVSTPYGVHGTVISAMTDADYTVPASEYCYQEIEVPATLTIAVVAKHFKLPTPAVEAFSYTKEVSNLNSGAFGLIVGRADGAGVTVTVAQNTKATIRIRPAGAYILATAIAAP